jgi:hypothetical protein
MAQLVSHKLPATRAVRVVLPLPKKDVLARGEGHSVHLSTERVGVRVRVDPNVAEVRSESRFHLDLHPAVGCLTTGARSLDSCFNIRHDFIKGELWFARSLPAQR